MDRLINSRQRPQGGLKQLSLPTVIIFSAWPSTAVIIAATAACSAQKPFEQAVSIHTPIYTFPLSASIAAPSSSGFRVFREPAWV